GEKLIETIAANNTNTVVVFSEPYPSLVYWIGHPNVTAAVVAHYTDQESGAAIASVPSGDVSPGDHLPYTIAHALEDYPSNTVMEDD
ncbi:hypothetical protein FOMPIDRAFT_17060, partial [Fomitopsis schrenkii]